MAKIYAELQIGTLRCPVLRTHYGLHQTVDAAGRPSSEVMTQKIRVWLDGEAAQKPLWLDWMLDSYKTVSGRLMYYSATGQRTGTVEFHKAHCVYYRETLHGQVQRVGGRDGGFNTDSIQESLIGAYPGALVIGEPSSASLILELHITAHTIALNGQTVEVYNLLPWKTSLAVRNRIRAQDLPSLPLNLYEQKAADRQQLAAEQQYERALHDQTELEAKRKRTALRNKLMADAGAKLTKDPCPPTAVKDALARLTLDNKAVEMARLSEYVYQLDSTTGLPNPNISAPPGWQLLNREELAKLGIPPGTVLADRGSGFKAGFFKSLLDPNAKTVVAFAGSELGPEQFFKDWITTDARQGFGYESAQYDLAKKVALAILKSPNPNNFMSVGHSLGGGLASMVTVIAGIKGYTFNAAGLNPKSLIEAKNMVDSLYKRALYDASRAYGKPLEDALLKAREPLIDAYHTKSDILTALQKNQNATNLALHPERNPLPLALGTERNLIPITDPALRSLTAPFQKSETTNPAAAHQISSAIGLIEERKTVDADTLNKYLKR